MLGLNDKGLQDLRYDEIVGRFSSWLLLNCGSTLCVDEEYEGLRVWPTLANLVKNAMIITLPRPSFFCRSEGWDRGKSLVSLSPVYTWLLCGILFALKHDCIRKWIGIIRDPTGDQRFEEPVAQSH